MARRKTKEEMKQCILQSAMDLLDERSYQQVTMDDIAKRACISKRTLYKYFSSKSVLFMTEFKDYFARFRENTILNDGLSTHPGMMMRHFMQKVFDFTKHRPAYYKLLLMYQANFFDNDLSKDELSELHEYIRSITRSNRVFLDEYWKDSLQRGYFETKSNAFLFQMMIALNKMIFIEYYYNRTSYDGDDPDLEEMLKTFSDMLYLCSNYDLQEDAYGLNRLNENIEKK